ncbi:MAG: sulfotransferase [Gammaproteobacteria bacterium]|nr:sulfotransferase [Gammaproteobacteria bacterium]
MKGKPSNNQKLATFKKNLLLEELLSDINASTELAEQYYFKDESINLNQPVVMIVGPPRSGSTLLLQLLAHSGLFCYPTNFLSRFYRSIGLGCRVQDMIFNPEFDYRGELLSSSSGVIEPFQSEFGKSKGPLAPNVFWYFWYTHFNFGQTHFLSKQQWQKSSLKRFNNELAILQNYHNTPVVLKAMVLNWNLVELSKLSNNIVFLFTQREPVDNCESILTARRKIYKDESTWWSFKPPEYEAIKNLEDNNEQIAAQWLSIDKACRYAQHQLPEARYKVINYQELCREPEKQIREALMHFNLRSDYVIKESFEPSVVSDQERINIWSKALASAENKIPFHF